MARDYPEPTDDAFRDAFDLTEIPDLSGLPDGPVVVLVAFNEEKRLPDFLRHHREIGASHFIVIDNASTDRTAEILDAAPDVTRLPSSQPFREFLRAWRGLVADRWLVGRWVIFPDADEQLVYPGWPAQPLAAALEYWTAQGVQAVHGPMVDMYADVPLAEIQTTSGDRLIDICSYFDGEGYWLAPPNLRSLRRYPVPPRMVTGSARQRLVNPGTKRFPKSWDRALRRLLPLSGSALPRRLQRLIHQLIVSNQPIRPGHQSKLPLVRWPKGARFYRAPHRLNAELKLAEDWVVLLHFKLLDDMEAKARTAIARKQHSNEARGYAETLPLIDDLSHQILTCEHSRQLRSYQDLTDVGLMPVSEGLRRHLSHADTARPANGAPQVDLTKGLP